jgi:hypothetical protein
MSKQKHSERPKYKQLAAQQTSKDGGPDKIWDVINEQSLDCYATMMSAAAPGKFIRNREDLMALSPDKQKKLLECMQKLETESKRLMNNLKTIREAHKDRKGSSRNEADFANAILINNQYIQWYDDWRENLLIIISDIVDIFADATGEKMILNPDHENDPTQPIVKFVPQDAPQFFDEATKTDTLVVPEAEPEASFVEKEQVI